MRIDQYLQLSKRENSRVERFLPRTYSDYVRILEEKQRKRSCTLDSHDIIIIVMIIMRYH